MNFRERFINTVCFKSVDRVPNIEIGYWAETINRWYGEGFPHSIPLKPQGKKRGRHPKEMDAYFGVDTHNVLPHIPVHFGEIPGSSIVSVENDGNNKITTLSSGEIIKANMKNPGIFQTIRSSVTDQKSWQHKKIYYNPNSPERFPGDWKKLITEYRSRDYPLRLEIGGFLWTMREWLGWEKLLILPYDDPAWLHEMIDFWTEFLLTMLSKILPMVTVDSIVIDEDLAGKNGPLMSPRHFKEFFCPGWRQISDFAHKYGVSLVSVDTDGYLDKSISLFLDNGINGLEPWEIQAGSDPLTVAKEFSELVILGGINKRAFVVGPDAIEKDLVPRVPELLKRGGYIPMVDHLIPFDVPLVNYMYYLERKKEIINGTKSTATKF